MAEQRDASRSKPPVSRSRVTPRASDRARQIPDLSRFISDFRTGLGKLRDLTQRMSGKATQPLSPNATSAARAEQREIMRTLERELKLIERVAPPEIRDRVVTEFRSKAESAIQMGVPQAYAQVLEGSKLIPAAAIRPNQTPAMRSLLDVAKAIKRGRLSFLPRKTRMEARKLLQRVFSSPRAIHGSRAAQMAPSGPQTAPVMPHTVDTIAQERLLPLVVQGMMRAHENPERSSTYIDVIEAARKQSVAPESREAPRSESVSAPSNKSATISSAGIQREEVYAAPTTARGPLPERPTVRPLSPQMSAQMMNTIPAFKSEGATHAFAFEPGQEEMHTFSKNDGIMTAAEMPVAPAGASQAAGKAPSSSGRAAPMSAPSASSPNSVSTGAQVQQASGSGKPVTVTGSLSIEGLPAFIAKTEMRLQGLESIARKQDG